MTCLRLTTPSRLHFGLFAWGPQAPRQFGGVGLMIDRPGLVLTAQVASGWQAEGPLADRTLRIAGRVAGLLAGRGVPIPAVRFSIDRAPPEHVGLGTGTQLSLAVARALTELAGMCDLPVADLAELTGRGLRSGIGLHGFAHGGLIVDGGRRTPEGIPPLLSRLEFPPAWSVLVVIPASTPGLHGPGEIQAFDGLPPLPDALTDRLCRLVLLGLMPAVVERDLVRFGEALTELQHHVGRLFAPAQGGTYARPELEAIVTWLRAEGLHGVGQSSWGPTLYGFSQAPADQQAAILHRLRVRFGLDPEAAFWTAGSGGFTTEARRARRRQEGEDKERS
jgi:beta-ribofuranosylaminobenzene 5'-phosphate synthase